LITTIQLFADDFDNNAIAEIKSESIGYYYLSIFNINGIMVENNEWYRSDDKLEERRINLDFKRYGAGVYFLKLISPDGIQVKKLNILK